MGRPGALTCVAREIVSFFVESSQSSAAAFELLRRALSGFFSRRSLLPTRIHAALVALRITYLVELILICLVIWYKQRIGLVNFRMRFYRKLPVTFPLQNALSSKAVSGKLVHARGFVLTSMHDSF
jgi:hypothetical protein